MKKLVALSSLLLIFLLAACGGGEPEPPQRLTVDYKFTNEFIFSPDTITATAGQPVTVNLDNTGASLSHSWILVPAGLGTAATPEEIDAQAIDRANSGEIVGGDSGSVSFVAPAAGEYEFVCTIPGHLVGGMVGKMTVTE